MDQEIRARSFRNKVTEVLSPVSNASTRYSTPTKNDIDVKHKRSFSYEMSKIKGYELLEHNPVKD